ncbi:MAG: YfiR family protein [Phenylobacterium sp.]|nr:MAG: YfiR family protein [Phenylobacterium sp.]
MTRRGSGWIGGALLALATLAATPTRAETGALEQAVKATYLYKLAPFVAWPPGAFNATDDPLVICVQGADAFAGLVDRAAAGQRVGPHPVLVRRLARLERTSGCHVAYVAGSQAQSTAQALAAVSGSPVLTVTDAERGPARGIVHLVLNSGKVRFSVNIGQAEAGGLAVSSKLLALALEVSR